MVMKWFRNARSAKWELLFTFIISGCVIISVLWFGLVHGGEWGNGLNWWLYGIITVLIVSAITGYISGVRLQRRLDVLHLSMMQVTKGNWSARIPDDEDASFARLYTDFNAMMQTMEHKLRLLQKLSEQQMIDWERESEAIVQEERKRLARDLHDTVSQQLFALHMSSSSLPKVMEMDMNRAKVVVEQLIQMSHIAQRQMRGLIAQLRPIELDGRTLEEALERWFPDYCNQNGLKGKIDIQLHEGLSEVKEHQCFLMIQEAMANVVKHAQARQVTLTMQEADSRIVLVVADDGRGFDMNKTAHGGSYGLSTMRERVDKLGGHMDLVSQPGAGTTIRVYIPLFEGNEQQAVIVQLEDGMKQGGGRSE
ncbi:sensor histidine kinase [Paenibacillus sp. ACRRX]|nr:MULTISPECIES: sensor histidine kinase [unclassified Paenibacillus]MCG7409819.1 sensor histidine kinase [Paenibacillus sp. ACRRX]MDK8183113.1 sensor histidine kinase [Paenibacillus sp. UMB4589-SE434]